MKNFIRIIVILSGLAIAIYFFSENSHGEQSAKQAYKVSAEKIKSNWIENEEGIKSLLSKLNRFHFEGQILLKNNGLISIWYCNSFHKNIDQVISLGQDFEDLLLMSDIEKDTIIANFTFEGNLEDEDLYFLLKKMKLSYSELNKLISDLNSIKCYGIAWNNDVSRIVYLGNPFSGSFEYISFESNIALEHRKFERLEKDIYWGFYESGMFCNTPFYIPN